MAYKGLNTVTSFVLLAEVDEAVALTRVGVRTLRDLRYISEESAAVLTLLSIGSEKMLKATLGLAALDGGETWPGKRTMQKWSHNLNAVNAAACALYSKQLQRSTAPGLIEQLLRECQNDPVLEALLTMLTDWGLQARFHRLDELAGQPQSGTPPMELWEELESEVLKAEPVLLTKLGTVDGYDEARSRVNDVIAESFLRWWQLHRRAWVTGVIGTDAKGISVALGRVFDG